MELLFLLLLGFLACFLGGLHVLGVFRQRRPGEPPLDKGGIPWLGHALEFGSNICAFLQRMRKKHGDVFTIQIGGVYMTILLDPVSLEDFFKQGVDTLNSREADNKTIEKAFGYVPVNKEASVLNHKLLQGEQVHILTELMTSNLQNVMFYNLEQRKWTEDGLFNYCYSTLFRTGFLTVFGNAEAKGDKGKAQAQDRADTQVILDEFRKYDQLFPKAMYGVLPSNLQTELQRLKAFFWDCLSMHKLRNKDNVSGWILDIQETLRQRGTPQTMIDRFMLCLLWASQGNTVPPAFWLLLYLMKDPEAMEAVRREADEVLKGCGQGLRGPLLHLTQDMLMKTPVLDSAIEETLRLVAAPLITRLVCQDTRLKSAAGAFLLRKGDRIAAFPHMALQTDPELHPDPHAFRYDRFLRPDGTRKREFYKGGKKVKFYSLPWGSGLPMCPGRSFALNEIKQFVFHLLVHFDFELVNPDENVPRYEAQRFGLGTLHPDRDVQFRYKLKLLK